MLEASNYDLTDQQRHELRQLFDSGVYGAYEDIVDFCRDILGEGEYRDFLTRTVGIGQPSRVHKMVAQLRVPAILTTNYDRLIEATLAQANGGLPIALTSKDTEILWKHLARRDFFVLKVHGDITRPDTLVFTSRDYTNHVFGNLPFMTFLQRLILSHSVLFIGSSLTDIYMRRILEETAYITRGVGLPHFALMPNPGSVKAKMLRERYNIRVIPYAVDQHGSHEPAILEILEALTEEAAALTGNLPEISSLTPNPIAPADA